MKVNLPDKCWNVDWCLGWNITEYNVIRAEYNCRTGKLIHLYAEKPHQKIICSEHDLDEHVFFNERDALNYLEKMESTELQGI